MGGSFYPDLLLAAADWKGMAAFAAAVGGPLIGIAGVSFAWFNGKSERDHESREARIQRLWAFRQETYLAASRYLERLTAWLDRTDPLIGPKPDPPDMDPDDEWLDLGARVAVGCSEAVRTAMRATVAATQVFESARTGWRLELDGHMPPSPPGETSARQTMDDARRVAIEAVHTAQTEMRDELESM